MTSYETIIKALKGRKTGLTLPELVAKTGLNENTARRALGVMRLYYTKTADRKCRVSGRVRTTYVAA